MVNILTGWGILPDLLGVHSCPRGGLVLTVWGYPDLLGVFSNVRSNAHKFGISWPRFAHRWAILVAFRGFDATRQFSWASSAPFDTSFLTSWGMQKPVILT